jgi:hypothetical protein
MRVVRVVGDVILNSSSRHFSNEKEFNPVALTEKLTQHGQGY